MFGERETSGWQINIGHSDGPTLSHPGTETSLHFWKDGKFMAGRKLDRLYSHPILEEKSITGYLSCEGQGDKEKG